ncbi:unnamed protein product, partial [Vitis vinifera]
MYDYICLLNFFLSNSSDGGDTHALISEGLYVDPILRRMDRSVRHLMRGVKLSDEGTPYEEKVFWCTISLSTMTLAIRGPTLGNKTRAPSTLKKDATAMAEEGVVTVYGSGAITDPAKTSFSIKAGMAQMLRGGAIFEVMNLDQAKIAEEAGASRVGHFVEAQILEAIGVDYIDESELSVADEDNFINKHNFRTPFVCGCRDLGEALRRVREGAVMIRIQGDLSGSGNVAETVRNVRKVMGDIRVLTNMDDDELGCDGVLVGSKIFGSADPYKRVRAIVQAVRHYNDAQVLAESCSELDVAVADLRIVEE